MINLVGNFSLSVFNHIRDRLIASGVGSGGVSGTFLEAYPDDDLMKRIVSPSEYNKATTIQQKNLLSTPVITFEEGPGPSPRGFELGSNDRINSQIYNLSIFASNRVQLDRLIGEIVFNVDQPIVLKDYNSDYNNPPTTGNLKIDPNSIRPFRVRDLSAKQVLRNRAEVLFEVEDK